MTYKKTEDDTDYFHYLNLHSCAQQSLLHNNNNQSLHFRVQLTTREKVQIEEHVTTSLDTRSKIMPCHSVSAFSFVEVTWVGNFKCNFVYSSLYMSCKIKGIHSNIDITFNKLFQIILICLQLTLNCHVTLFSLKSYR